MIRTLIFPLILGLSAAITFEKNGYKDVIVSIHPDVPETNAVAIISGIKVAANIQRLFLFIK